MEAQIKRLAIFYLAFSFVDLMLLGIGNIIDTNEDFIFDCVSTWYLLIIKNEGVWFILFHGLFFYLFSLLIWYIFYRLPDNYGLIRKKDAKDLRMTNFYKSHVSSNLKETEVMEEFMKLSQQSEAPPLSPTKIRKTSAIATTDTQVLPSPNQLHRAQTVINRYGGT